MMFHYLAKMKMAGGRPSPYCFGGGSKSDSSTQTTSNTSNLTNYNDKRAVGQDEAISLGGDGNVVNRSTSNLTSFIDSSNRSSSSNTSFVDNSNRSVSMTTTNVTTDHGAVAAGLGLGTKALDTVGATTKQAFALATIQAENGLKATQAAFDLAKSSGANSLAGSAAVLGFASDTIKEARTAFQEADDNGQKTIAVYAILAVGAIGVAMAVRS